MRMKCMIWNFVCFVAAVDSCGILTHLLISHRAKDNYKGNTAQHNYHQMIDRHQDAFFAGSTFSDALGKSCADGQYVNIADDTHWAPFLNATINYIRKLPQPWDNSTEKLVTFMFGMVSHQVSDILWEGIGIDQSFISAMANINFHGSVNDSKQAAYLGEDAVNGYLFEYYFIDFFDDPEWYVPTEDLVNIFKDFYGTEKIGKDVIDNCTTLQLVEAAVEELGVSELYPEVAKLSPFLVDQQTDYFIGGIDEMTMWSQRLWNDAVTMLENGTNICSIPKNTLFINCTGPANKRSNREMSKHHTYTPALKYEVKQGDFQSDRNYRGITVRLTGKLKGKVRKHIKTIKAKHMRALSKLSRKKDVYAKMSFLPYPCFQDSVFSYFKVNNTYSKFGWTFIVKDLDNDGNDDVIIGAPKYSADDISGQGRVYILYGYDSGFMMCDYQNVNVNEFMNFTSFIRAPLWKTDIGFGTSVATLDINLDGIQDIAVGAPLIGQDFLQYNGAVYIYFGKSNSRYFGAPNITIRCESKYCNLGYTLAVSDINFDGKDDLVIGTPFYQSPNPQTGIVSALTSSTANTGLQSHNFEDLIKSWSLAAKQAYGWFGHNIRAKYNVLMINQPFFRHCGRSDCVISNNDTQSVGRLNIYNMGTTVKMTNFTVTGTSEFQSTGYSSDIGFPYGKDSLILAVGIPGANVNGTILTVPFKFSQAGTVVLYNITSAGPTEIARFEGNRHYSRYGSFVKFTDINGDNMDDLIISAPKYSIDWSGLDPFIGENGKVFIYYGGKDFPTGDVTNRNCSDATVTPCTGKLSNVTWTDDLSDKNIFGLGVDVVKTKHQIGSCKVMKYGKKTVAKTSISGSYSDLLLDFTAMKALTKLC